MSDNAEKDSAEGSSSYDSDSDSDSSLTNLFGNVNPETMALLKERMKQTQKQFAIFNTNQMNQKIADVQKMYPQMDEKTAKIALDSCNNNEILLSRRIRDEPILLQQIMDMGSGKIPLDMKLIQWIDPKKVPQPDPAPHTSDEDNEEWGTMSKSKKEKKRAKESSDSSVDSDSVFTERKRKAPRIRLNDALKRACLQHKSNEQYAKNRKGATASSKAKRKTKSSHDKDTGFDFVPKYVMSGVSQEQDYAESVNYFQRTNVSTRQLKELGWSDARIKAFKKRLDNPNQYYYRFNDPGEAQETGPWSSHDRFLFLKQVIELGVDYSWGMFSMKIPGRVGYQCSNYYRQLIREGVIIDDNYYIDEKNKLSFKFKSHFGNEKTQKRHAHQRKKKYEESSDGEEELDNVDFDYSQEENCLPGFIDVMTYEEVVKPAISPYGHVLGYNSWIRVLNREPKNTCPFTKKKLTHRQLVRLTFANIDEYRDKIIDLNVK